MATLSQNALTLLDIAKRTDPDGRPARVAELLTQMNPMLEDIPFVEANNGTGHRVTIRTGLPTVAWRLLNQGVQPSKSTTAQVDEGTGILEAWSEVDKDVAELNGNLSGYRLSEAIPFLEAMAQEKASTLFYGNSSVAPEEFNGLAVRYSDLSTANGANIIDAGGTGSDNMSIWLITWSPETVFGIYPKGSTVGLNHMDLGLQTVESTAGIAGQRLLAYRDRYQWKCGVVLKDWRYAVRIANIDTSDLVAGGAGAAALIDFMIRASHRIHNLNAGKSMFYLNRTAFQELDLQRLSTAGSAGLSYADVDGRQQPMFRNIPIRITDALVETEARVV